MLNNIYGSLWFNRALCRKFPAMQCACRWTRLRAGCQAGCRLARWRLGVAVLDVAVVPSEAHVAPAGAALRAAVMEWQRGASGEGGLDSLGKRLQSMVTTELAQVSSLQLV